MNERIFELAEQAWDSLIDDIGDVVSEDGKLNWNFLHAYDKKFAELILTEVISTVYRSDISDKKQEKLVDELAYKFGMK